MISVYLKYSICKCLFQLKTKINFTASSLHSKQKGGEYPSVSFPPQYLCSLLDSSARGLGQASVDGFFEAVRMAEFEENTEAGQCGPNRTLSLCQHNCRIEPSIP